MYCRDTVMRGDVGVVFGVGLFAINSAVFIGEMVVWFVGSRDVNGVQV